MMVVVGAGEEGLDCFALYFVVAVLVCWVPFAGVCKGVTVLPFGIL